MGGNIGIGTTGPLAKLEVDVAAGTVLQNVLKLWNQDTSVGSSASIDFYHGGGAGNKNARIRNYATGANAGDLYLDTANGSDFANDEESGSDLRNR